ncbi:MAG: CRISPR-associated protein Cas4 [Methanophagales archaeon]|nr:CRISPR-associated protein Cas4 [Methanophagales archaeon]
MKLLHTLLSKGEENMDLIDIAFQESQVKIQPTPIQIGISTPATPDFLIEKYSAVGDIKSGVKFEDHYLLTCAGYALAYENWKRKEKRDINFGIIYFFPTRIPTDYAKPFTFAQMYVFPIDDVLRKWFLEERDNAYETIIKDGMPDFPKNKEHCEHCQYIEACKETGLEI